MGSVKEEITRLETAKKDIETAIETCGVNVPDTELIDTYASYIRQIPSAVFSGLNVDPVGGSDQFIQSIKQTNGLIEATVGGLVSTSNSGLVPKADGSAGIINNQSDDYVLTYKGGTIDWYKLPANAFTNDDNNTTYTLSGTLNGNAYDVTLTPSSGTATGAKVPAMGAASSSAAGTAGLVPAPAKNEHNSFLRGDGTWVVPDNATYSVMTGATTSTDGKSGLVPQPAKGDQGKFLSGAGTWAVLPSLSITDSESGNAVTNVEVSGHSITLKRGTTFSVNGHIHSSDDITSLPNYVKATTASAIASTDSLNTALGKLELKADTAYTLTAGAYDGDGTIENLAEILKVLEGISDTDTIQAIVGKYLPLSGGTLTGGLTISSGNLIVSSSGGDTVTNKLYPTADNTYSLGQNTRRWSDIRTVLINGGTPIHSGNIGTQSVAYATDSGNADTVDNLHASDLVKFYLSPMDSGATAGSAKTWFTDTMPAASGAIVYNVPGAEKTIIAGKSSGSHGHMLQLNYDDTYLRILRYYAGTWKSTDWEKISAGHADKASCLHFANVGGGSSSTHDSVLKNYFNNNKTSIPRNNLLGMYSGAYGNGSYYMGYWLSGYDTNPYGGFFVAHYANPYYVGISNGTYTTQAILTSTNYTNYTVQKDGTGATGNWAINITGNADTVDSYHASSLWRSDGATWNPGANVTCNASANDQEWSFDIYRNSKTGCYWHVWDNALGTMLKVNADDGKVSAPYGFVGNLTGKASALTDLATGDEASSTATKRKVWFSYNDGITGRPALSANLTFQSSTNTLFSTNFNGNLIGNASSATKVSNYYASRPTSIAPGISGDGSMFHFKCTSSVTDATTDPGDAHILHFNWDNTGGYDFQIAGLTSSSTMKIRGMSSGSWLSWATVLTSANYTSYVSNTNYYHTPSYSSGLSIASGTGVNTMYVPNAGASQAGVVSTGAQTFSGAKTFSGAMTVNSTITFGQSDGYGIRTSTDNYGRIGESSKRFYQCYVKNSYSTNGFWEDSDERLKNIIKPIKVNLDELSKLRKIYYIWKNPKDDQSLQLGMIAQDVQRLYPELVSVDKETGYLSLAYDRLSVLALEALDVLYNDYIKLKERVDKLEKFIIDQGI